MKTFEKHLPYKKDDIKKAIKITLAQWQALIRKKNLQKVMLVFHLL